MEKESPDRASGREQKILTQDEHRELESAQQLQGILEEMQTWVENDLMPAYEELEETLKTMVSSANPDMMDQVQQKRQNLAAAIAMNNPSMKLKDEKILNELIGFGVKNGKNITKMLTNLVIANPNRFHPVNIEEYQKRVNEAKSTIDSFAAYIVSPRRGDNRWGRASRLASGQSPDLSQEMGADL